MILKKSDGKVPVSSSDGKVPVRFIAIALRSTLARSGSTW